MWKLHDTAIVWHVLECFNSWINAEEMLITCQAAHNEHAFNKTGRLTDCNPMTDYTVADYKSKKRDIALHSVQNTHPLHFWMSRLYTEQMRGRTLPSKCTCTSAAIRPRSNRFGLHLEPEHHQLPGQHHPDWAAAWRLFPWPGIKPGLPTGPGTTH